MKRYITGSIMIVILLGIGGWVLFQTPFLQNSGDGEINTDEEGISILDLPAVEAGERPVKEFELTAEETSWTVEGEETVQAWTYNGTVPGEPLRVQQRDFVRVELTNELDVPVTIHWHGVVLQNRMDGVPGVTQDAVKPGESFTYEFIANNPGTYWYHSHQHSSLQVDKGLYGPLIIEGDGPSVDKERTYMLDEWAVNQERQDWTNMAGMMMGSMNGDGEADTKQMYDTFTINGKAGSAIEPLEMKEGETARLRFVNAGYQLHRLVFPEGSMEMLSVDAEKVESASERNVLEIAPGERMDVLFTKGEGAQQIAHTTDVEHAADMKIPVLSPDSERTAASAPKTDTEAVKGTSYKSEELLFDNVPKADVSYDMDLSMGMNMGEGMAWQINEEIFPDTPPIHVNEGDIVKVDITNEGRLNHPMHLHGHRFQVQSESGGGVVKDLINVKPGESYTIYFEADNRGEWLFHCHDNNHADRGMVTVVDYEGVYSPFELNETNSP
ncbi:multicopper oxidase family protein [Salimicrobium halophilum]|uniref:Multicopper oxidase with three cupredoxin domains (Includes cell division protein FtsP and spore coat protein CotA) n=1 Tax=Salimicrobium halophilum TaxID=86666 RepID=A0A1G8TXV6_9BACI|nr:multicopper oxidase family protein [Salimicrobium halophilum]SDJ46329.1 Multicopper oxidase with three cupredoxin domains (includes cell division protein FtsP and spore coat protein CotA) [Salimicrobium halophilum]